jgi:predicted RNase H-like HicB family nuclease
MTEAENYSVVVRRVVLEGEAVYEARVKEFPDLTEYADSAEEAYALVIDAIETVASIYAEKGREMPAVSEPASEFSGRVTLKRMSVSINIW